jgi:tRNA dimethylallyltransferase
MDIGTGKVTKKEMGGVPHHVLDVADPRRRYSVARFKRDADNAIADIVRRGKVPILCGGTGYYVEAIVDDVVLPEVKPNKKLRKELEGLSATELFARLTKLDATRAQTIDPENPRRLIRAIEIATALGNVPTAKRRERYNTLQIGIRVPVEGLKELIYTRLIARVRRGMVAEARRLHTQGVSWRRMDELGLEYRYLAQLLQNKLTRNEFLEKLSTAVYQFAKRQRTWFKRDTRIEWFERGTDEEVLKRAQQFLVN